MTDGYLTCELPLGISTHTLTWSVTEQTDYVIEQNCISTHTLTWSVTFLLLIILTLTIISTHTLTWSVTIYIYRSEFVRCKYFNSHAHVERDVFKMTISNYYVRISTHTLTWSVTNMPSLRSAAF